MQDVQEVLQGLYDAEDDRQPENDSDRIQPPEGVDIRTVEEREDAPVDETERPPEAPEKAEDYEPLDTVVA